MKVDSEINNWDDKKDRWGGRLESASGFSLAGVVAAIGISSLLMFGLYRAVAEVVSAQRVMKSHKRADNFVDLVKATVTSSSYCRKSFENVPIKRFQLKQSQDVAFNIRSMDASGNLGAVVYGNNTEVAQGLTLERFSLQLDVHLGGGQYVGFLKAVLSDDVVKSGPGKVIVKEIPLFMTLSPQGAGFKVDNCRSGGGGGGTDPDDPSPGGAPHTKDANYGLCVVRFENYGIRASGTGSSVSSDGVKFVKAKNNGYRREAASAAVDPFEKCDSLPKPNTKSTISEVKCKSGYKKVLTNSTYTKREDIGSTSNSYYSCMKL
jgi:hypothetical protein